WQPPSALHPFLALLAVDAGGGERATLRSRGDANLFWRDGSPAACTTRVLRPPYYVKLYCPLPSPWVFDGWGWCRFGAPLALPRWASAASWCRIPRSTHMSMAGGAGGMGS